MAIDLANLPLSGPDGSTTIVDSSGRNPWLIAPGSNAQIQSNALLLDGVGDYIFAPGGDFVFNTFDFTINLEVRTTQGGDRVLVDMYTGSTRSWQLGMRAGKFYWFVTGAPNSGYWFTGTATFNDGNWHELKVERTAGVTRFYVDGVLDGSIADTTDYNILATSIGVGARVTSRSAAYDFAGSIRNVVISRPDSPGANSFSQHVRSIFASNVAALFTQFKRHHIWTPPFTDKVKVFEQFGRTRGVPPWWGPVGSTTQLPTYKIRGRVMQRDPDGVLPDWPLANVRVALFYRRLNALLDVQLSDENGYVQFDNLMPGNGAYYGIAFDNEGSPLQNSIIWDRLSSEPGP